MRSQRDCRLRLNLLRFLKNTFILIYTQIKKNIYIYIESELSIRNVWLKIFRIYIYKFSTSNRIESNFISLNPN